MATRDQILSSPAFHAFVESVTQQLQELTPDSETLKPTLLAERAQLEQQCMGWSLSLGKSSLPPMVRCVLEEDLAKAIERIACIDARLSELDASSDQLQLAVSPEDVAERLEQLGEILAGNNASATNLILAQHIAGIYCNAEGSVAVRTCLLGALGNPFHLLSKGDAEADAVRAEVDAAQPTARRRRPKRDIRHDCDDDEQTDAANDFAVDPQRFAGLGPEWFTSDTFQVPRRLSWAEEHALEVAQFRLETGATMEKTAERFDKTIPTIRAALRYARDLHGVDAFGKSVSESTRAFWPRDNAEEVAEFFRRPSATMKEAQEHFGKSQPWISKAKKIAQERGLDVESSTPGSPGAQAPS